MAFIELKEVKFYKKFKEYDELIKDGEYYEANQKEIEKNKNVVIDDIFVLKYVIRLKYKKGRKNCTKVRRKRKIDKKK